MLDEFRRNFSEAIELIRRGEEVTIQSGRKHKNIAVLVPFEKYTESHIRKLGILETKASFKMNEDFKISDEELLTS